MRAKIRSLAFLTVGHVSVLIGTIGIVIPILPTTPFLLLACFCYERGSPRIHGMLLDNRHLGPYIKNWERYGVIPTRAKVVAIIMIATSIGWIVYSAPLVTIKALMAIVGVGVSAYIITRPSTPKKKEEQT